MKIVLCTGGYDPLHSGHISYIKAARELGDRLVVGLNSDEWLERKKGRAFMPWEERATILAELKDVDRIINFNDNDDSAIDAIRKTKSLWPNENIIFANGGDRTKNNIPEMLSFEDVEFVFGIGGEDKKNSSSWILEDWKSPKTERAWGYYRVLHEVGNEVKVKELTVDPGKRLSMQRHRDRAEHWFIAEGTAAVYTVNPSTTDMEFLGSYDKHKSVHICKTEWHQLANETDKPLRVVEIQYGTNCVEEDIERR